VDGAGVDPPSLRLFLPVVGLAVSGSLFFLWRLPEPPRAATTERFSIRGALRALAARPLIPVWIVTTLFSGLVAVFLAFVTVVAQRRGIAHPSTLFFAYAGAAALVRTVGARIPDRLGPGNLVVPAIASYVGALLVAAGAWSELGFLVAGALAGVGHGYGFPVLIAQAIERTPTHLRGSSLALYTALWAASSLLLTPIFGAVADAWDDASMFSLAATVAVAVLTVWVGVEHLLVRHHGSQG
jgi:predicted MFS family arabinose efflux permease